MQIKRLKNISFFFIVLLPLILFSDQRILDFQASRNENSVTLTWSTRNESNITCFKLKRSNDMNVWYSIDQKINANNTPSNYTFTDQTLFKTLDSDYFYTLVIFNKDGSKTTHDEIARCSGVSGFRHTWGSIKAIFR